MNTQITRDPFEFADEAFPVTVNLRGKSKVYHFHDISKAEFDELYRPTNEAGDDAAAKAVANKALLGNAISLVVRQTDGTRISPEAVSEMRATLVNKLALKVMAFLTGGDVEAAGEDKPEEDEPEKKD